MVGNNVWFYKIKSEKNIKKLDRILHCESVRFISASLAEHNSARRKTASDNKINL